MIGERYGRWLVISAEADYVGPSGAKQKMWLCQCDCGTRKVVHQPSLRSGLSKSCGCFRREFSKAAATVHGHGNRNRKSPTYVSWGGMISRCQDCKNNQWENYGGRGIKVCSRWRNFENFLADMGERPSKSHSIDRLNADGDYEPSNCRWATASQQGRNRRNNRMVHYLGKQRALSEACELAGLNYKTVHARLQSGWPLNLALSTEIGAKPARRTNASVHPV